jgi:hypothetical protein
MTFIEFLKTKKGIDTRGRDISEFMDDYYEEYSEYLMSLKEGCAEADTGG